MSYIEEHTDKKNRNMHQNMLAVLTLFFCIWCKRWYNSGADGSGAVSAQIAAEHNSQEISQRTVTPR
jgi:hypothetical protein